MGRRAREKVVEKFSRDREADEISAVYHGSGRRRRRVKLSQKRHQRARGKCLLTGVDHPPALSRFRMMMHKERRGHDQKLLHVPIFVACGTWCSWT